MNIFATIVDVKRFNKVGYYSIKAENKRNSETDDFFRRMMAIKKNENDLARLVYWMRKIGDDIGALDDFFRPEKNCRALPPKVKITGQSIKLRLYCYKIDDHIVVLFNGDIKTAKTAQDCPNVAKHFFNAQDWSESISDLYIKTDFINIVNQMELQIPYAETNE